MHSYLCVETVRHPDVTQHTSLRVPHTYSHTFILCPQRSVLSHNCPIHKAKMSFQQPILTWWKLRHTCMCTRAHTITHPLPLSLSATPCHATRCLVQMSGNEKGPNAGRGAPSIPGHWKHACTHKWTFIIIQWDSPPCSISLKSIQMTHKSGPWFDNWEVRQHSNCLSSKHQV